MTTTSKPHQPIGIFDSGIGGLTVANAIVQRLPLEQIVYFGDTAHLPYGEKSADAIRYFSLKIGKFLLDKNCKMIVIACNSASSAAYDVLLEFFSKKVLFINVVDPLVEAVTKKNYRRIGLIATKATVHSRAYEQRLKQQQPDLQVYSKATPLLVPMIEEGYFSNQLSDSIISNYLSVDAFKNIDALLLACTHYPLIRNKIEAYFSGRVDIFDSTDVVAKKVEAYLEKHNLLRAGPRGPHTFYVSDYTEAFEQTARYFYKEHIHLEQCPIW